MSIVPGSALGPGREFNLVRRMKDRWGTAGLGIGDDAAILDVPPGTRLVASTDTSLDGVHFRLDWLTVAEAGYRAVTAAVSDLAAMAADPLGILVAATLPPAAVERIEDLADGLGEGARAAGCPIVGGDLTRGAQLGLTITVLGASDAPVTRAGARPGDSVYVTGLLGGPGAALEALLAGRAPAQTHRDRFARPRARVREARWLAAEGIRALIDISDGLAADAQHVAAASAVRIELDLDRLPVVAGVDPVDAAASGEEYELLAVAPDELDAGRFAAEFGLPLRRIGRVVPGAGVEMVRHGERVDLPRGYDHFSR